MHLYSGATFSIINVRAGTSGASALNTCSPIMVKASGTYIFSAKIASVHFSGHAAYVADTRDFHCLPQKF